MFKMFAFSVDTDWQWTLPLISSVIHRLEFYLLLLLSFQTEVYFIDHSVHTVLAWLVYAVYCVRIQQQHCLL